MSRWAVQVYIIKWPIIDDLNRQWESWHDYCISVYSLRRERYEEENHIGVIAPAELFGTLK